MKEGIKELYDRLYAESGYGELEKEKNAKTKKILIAIAICIFVMFIYPPILFIAIIVLFIYVIVLSKKQNSAKQTKIVKYDMFKEEIIKPLLEYNFDGIQYMYNEGMSLEEYLRAHYIDRDPQRLDRYYSNDHIILPLEVEKNNNLTIDIYDVCLERIHKSNNGKTSTETIFQGFTGMTVLPKSIDGEIKLNFAYSLFGLESKRADKVDLDMAEFEKNFNLIANDKVLAMRIYTSEIMQELLDIFKNYRRIYDINIINDKLYIRVAGSSIFEEQIVIGGSSFYIAKQGILMLEELQILMQLIYNIINNMEI